MNKKHKETDKTSSYNIFKLNNIKLKRIIMKKSLVSIALLLSSVSAFAETEYPENQVLRPLTLTAGTIAVGGAIAWGEENNDNHGEVNVNAAYGFTDNLTVSIGNINYRILARPDNKTGLELTLGLGLRGFQETINNEDSFAYGGDLNGKYVIDENTAMIFSLGYVLWDEEKQKNKDEFRYSVGFQTNITKNWSTTTSYMYRDLNDFIQKDAHEFTVNANYALSKNTDIGIFTTYTNFDAQQNGYKNDNNFERAAGIYAVYRF